jgi:hypothetical protein
LRIPQLNGPKVIIIFNLLSIPILPLCKASIIILLLHVGRILDRVRRALYAVFVFNALAAVIPWALFIFICPDAPHNTTPTVFGGLKCLDREAQGVVLVFVNSANLLTDLLVFPIPFFIMHELMNTTWRSKLTILLTFATSLWYVDPHVILYRFPENCEVLTDTLVTSVTALTAVKIRLTEQDRIMFADCSHYHPCRAAKPDWMYSLDYCITHAEANVGIMVACIPTLRGLIFPRRQSTSTSTTSTAFSDPNRSSPFNTSFWPYNNGGRSMLGSNDPTARGSQEQQDGLTEKFGKKAGEEDGSSGRTVVLVVPQRDVLDHHTFHATPPLPPPSDSD